MDDINCVVIAGRLTRESELKYFNSGSSVLNFSMASNRSVKRGDNWESEASFFDVELFGKMGESLQKYLTKGKQVIVSGSLKQQRWEQEGHSRSKILITANKIQLVGGEKHEQQNTAHEMVSKAFSGPEMFSDDIPF